MTPLMKVTGTRFIHLRFTIEEILLKFGYIPKQFKNIIVSVDIPGGGDYSNCTLEIGNEIKTLDFTIEEKIK